MASFASPRCKICHIYCVYDWPEQTCSVCEALKQRLQENGAYRKLVERILYLIDEEKEKKEENA